MLLFFLCYHFIVRKTLDAKDSKDLTCLQLDQTAAKYQRSPLSASKSTPDLTAEVSLSELESPFIPNPRSVSTLCSKGCGMQLFSKMCAQIIETFYLMSSSVLFES